MPDDVTLDAIAVTDLVKSYDGVRVVDHVSLRVASGTLCALLGPNGAGKTTLSECISGFRTPDAGWVRVLGLDPVADRDRVTASLGVMLQEGGVYPSATPREMLELYTRLHHSSRSPSRLLDLVGLATKSRTRCRHLSGGQKQRLNLALALVGRPRVLVLDEPTAAMDPTGRAVAWGVLRSLRDDGVAVLFTTHDLREAERLADRVLVIDRGRLVADDTPSALAAAGDDDYVLVTTPVPIDGHALSRRLGTQVVPDGNGRWRVRAGASAIPDITEWFSRQGLPVTGVTVEGSDLESVFSRLTAEDVTPARSAP